MGAPVCLESDVDSGAVLVSYYSDGHWSGKRRDVYDPCGEVGAIGGGVLCCLGDRCFGSGSKDVDGARLDDSIGQRVLMPRFDASCSSPAIKAHDGGSGESSSSSGISDVLPCSSGPHSGSASCVYPTCSNPVA